MSKQDQVLENESLDPFAVELKLNADGSLDTGYYQAQAEALRAAYLKGLFASLFQNLKKAFRGIDFGQLSTPKANIVSSQKLTLSI